MTKSKRSKTTKTKKVARRAKKDRNIVIGYKTVSTKMASWHDPKYKFVVGKEHLPTLTPKAGDTAPCGIGLHFCRNQEDVANYTCNDDYILLEVQANKSDILGEDDTKTRVAKLKVNKILERVEMCGPEWKAAEKEVKTVVKNLLVPNKQATPQKLSGLVQAWARAMGYKKIKTHITTHITDNFYEVHHHLADGVVGDFHYDWGDSYTDISLKNLPIDNYGYLNERIGSILSAYLASFEGLGRKGQKAEFAPLFEMLKLGVLPVGVSYHSRNKTLLIYAPKTNPYKMKRPF